MLRWPEEGALPIQSSILCLFLTIFSTGDKSQPVCGEPFVKKKGLHIDTMGLAQKTEEVVGDRPAGISRVIRQC
jgi:hypothetical protein